MIKITVWIPFIVLPPSLYKFTVKSKENVVLSELDIPTIFIRL